MIHRTAPLAAICSLLLVAPSSAETASTGGDFTAPATTLPATTSPSRQPSPFIRPRAKPTARPVEAIRRVLVISVDGLRPDLLLRGDTPNIHGMMSRGAYSMWARTTPNSITLPSHVSMMTGVSPRRHSIEWNRDLDTVEPLWPGVPTLLEAAKRHGYTTAVAAGKDKFDMFDRPGVLDWRWIPAKGAKETADVLKAALAILADHRPDVMLVHFPSVDAAGHLKGWASREQMKAIADADKAVGALLDEIDDLGLTESTLVILSADHGGAAKSHGPEDARSRHIPWIAVGPGIAADLDLTSFPKLNVNTEDTFATACWALGIPPTVADLDGVPVKAILKPDDAELLRPIAPTAQKAPASW